MSDIKSSIGAILLLVAGIANANDIDPCDEAASHPADPDKVSPGVETAEVLASNAIEVCRAAVAREPDNARFHYQLGRALYYRAATDSADTSEATSYVQKAAEMGYTQAMFVRGYLHQLEGSQCQAEPLIRGAADKGLKSGHLTYVDNVLAGRYDECNKFADRKRMEAYLAAAEAQVEGYYEQLLLAGLKRQLEAAE